jgi:hypothetical protein
MVGLEPERISAPDFRSLGQAVRKFFSAASRIKRRGGLMAKLGMREEGVFRENILARGEWWSSVQSSILSAEWGRATNIQ